MITITHFSGYCVPLTFPGDVAISGGMIFTEDSDINGASPRFTLTCISTGGPATTVTWTRDSDTVTEGTETVLDDPVTAQYTHTLTVTGRLGGLYTCTVGNDKPSEDSAQLNLQIGNYNRLCNIILCAVVFYVAVHCLALICIIVSVGAFKHLKVL